MAGFEGQTGEFCLVNLVKLGVMFLQNVVADEPFLPLYIWLIVPILTCLQTWLQSNVITFRVELVPFTLLISTALIFTEPDKPEGYWLFGQ